jgi:signal transduction histidine kinase
LFAFIGAQIFHQQDFRVRRALEMKADELDALAKKRTRTLEEFSAMIVHELRAPLTAQRWTMEALLDEPRIDRRALRESLLNMQSATAGMMTIVNDFLDATKLDVGEFIIEAKKGDLSRVI